MDTTGFVAAEPRQELLFFVFLGPHPQHMEVPRLGVESELQLPAYAIGTAMQDQSHVYDLHHSSRQRRIPNPLSKARDRTHNLMVPRQIHFCCAMTGTPPVTILFFLSFVVVVVAISWAAPAAYGGSQARG